MKVVYLDQNHWIELTRAAHDRSPRSETVRVLHTLREAAAMGHAVFPLSLGHWIETFKQHAADRRKRLAQVMVALSHGLTVAPPDVVARYEAQSALSRAFPDRVPEPPPLQYVGRGLAHASDGPFRFTLESPGDSPIPEPERKALEDRLLRLIELSVLSGTLPTGEPIAMGPLTDLAPDRRFKAGLDEWRGAAGRYPPTELKRRIYAVTLADVESFFREVLQRHGVPIEDLASLGEAAWCRILDDMPSRRADMHLRGEWAKNADLSPKDSDLNDWAYLGVAVAYCDVVVTEKQVADMFNRGLTTRAKVIAKLPELPALLK